MVLPSRETPLRERAYQSFKEHLLSRDIRPGQFLSQRELVAITGMPLGAIRELVPRLEADGLIITVPQRGLQVAHVDIDLIRNAFQLRQILELEAVGHFCRAASEAEIADLHAQHLAIRQETLDDLTPDLVTRAQNLDWAFHDRMIASLGNALIANVYRVNAVKIRLIRQERTRLLPELATAVMDEHLKVLDALVARDAPAATEALAQHIDIARRRALGV